MLIVNVVGWKPGFKTISFMRLIREQGSAARGLPEAKQLVDGLLQGKRFAMKFTTQNEASSFITQAKELGAITDGPERSGKS
jgi:hypothetical protein